MGVRLPPPPPPRRFVVLVSGTVVYSKGDERAMAEELAEELLQEESEAVGAQAAAPGAPGGLLGRGRGLWWVGGWVVR
jgi:hypothetical protein